jgi:hypothetical protein
MSFGGGDWVCLSWPMGVCLSLYPHSFGLLLLLSHLCLNSFLHSFVFDALEYAYDPLFKMHPMFVCYLLGVSTLLFSFDALEFAYEFHSSNAPNVV